MRQKQFFIKIKCGAQPMPFQIHGQELSCRVGTNIFNDYSNTQIIKNSLIAISKDKNGTLLSLAQMCFLLFRIHHPQNDQNCYCIFISQYNQRITAYMLQHNKQNHILSANAISSAQSAQYTKKEDGNDAIFGKVLAVVHSDGMERVRREVASQQNKNRLMYDQIREKNEYFSYQLLPKIAVESNHHVLMREHGKLLQEEAFLFKELTKIQWMQRVSNTHEDAFNFLLQVWQRHEREAETAEERMDRLIKNVSYLKTNMKSACDNTGADHLAFSRNIILHSPEYIELSQRYQAINKKLEQSNNGVKKMDEEVGKLRSDNQCLRKENKELQTKLSYYQIKSKELLSKVAALTQDLIQQQRKSYQSQHTLTKRYESVEKWQNTPIFEISIKVNGETAPEGGNAIRRTACIAVERSLQEIVDFIEGAKDTSLKYSSVLSFQSNSLDVSEDKESTLSDIINDLQANEDQVPSYSSTKKAKHAKNRQLLFGHCNTASKELRFIRRK